MEEIVDLIATNSSAADVSDAIKNSLFMKASERVDSFKPHIASSLFDGEDENLNTDEE